MWNKIVNPETGRNVKISTKLGKSILNRYLNSIMHASGHQESSECPDLVEITQPDFINEIS